MFISITSRFHFYSLLALKQQHVPSKIYLARSCDPPWFGYQCRAATEAKHAAWVRFKRRPTPHNCAQHRTARRRMKATCRWARQQQQEDLKQNPLWLRSWPQNLVEACQEATRDGSPRSCSSTSQASWDNSYIPVVRTRLLYTLNFSPQKWKSAMWEDVHLTSIRKQSTL